MPRLRLNGDAREVSVLTNAEVCRVLQEVVKVSPQARATNIIGREPSLQRAFLSGWCAQCELTTSRLHEVTIPTEEPR